MCENEMEKRCSFLALFRFDDIPPWRSAHPFPVNRELEHHIALIKTLGGIESLPVTLAGRKHPAASQTLM